MSPFVTTGTGCLTLEAERQFLTVYGLKSKASIAEALDQARDKQSQLSAATDDYALYNFSIGFEGMGHRDTEATTAGLALAGVPTFQSNATHTERSAPEFTP